jgi:hypothetical protein
VLVVAEETVEAVVNHSGWTPRVLECWGTEFMPTPVSVTHRDRKRPAPRGMGAGRFHVSPCLTQPARTVRIMGILASWRTPDSRWLVDRVYSEGDVDYRIYEEGELVAELHGPLETLVQWLARRGVDIGDLEPLPEGEDGDPFGE